MKSTPMRAWQLHDFGLEHVRLGEVSVPVPGPDEVLMRVGAVALNFRDKAIIEGFYNPEILKDGPLTLVADAAGTVAEIGRNVTRVEVGDRVTSHMYSHWADGAPRNDEADYTLGGPLPGGLAEYMVLPENAAVPRPGYLTDQEAATLPIAALTAWSALAHFGQRRAGDTVLVQGTGGVSIFAIQLAAAMGVKVIATTSSDAKGEKAKALGASHIINYAQTPKWEDTVLALTGGRGVDQVLEVVGGEKSINQSIQAARAGGLITIIGFLDSPEAKVTLIPMMYRQSCLQGVAVGHRKAFDAMNVFLDEQRIHPVIDRVYPFEQALDALRHLDQGAFGKIVITVFQQDR